MVVWKGHIVSKSSIEMKLSQQLEYRLNPCIIKLKGRGFRLEVQALKGIKIIIP